MLLDGWGMQDTHETLNSFIWGPDGWLYGCHGVFTHSHIAGPAHRRPAHANERGRVALPSRAARVRGLRHGTSNPWGLDYDEHGEFFITACVIPHLYHIVLGARYQRRAGSTSIPHL